MKDMTNFDEFEVGFDIPAKPGMDETDIQPPCLVLDLDALDRNIKKMGDYARDHGMRHRTHGKMHKSVDVQEMQEELGGACGVCCQKVAEAEVFARGGIKDVLVSNQVRDAAKIDRLARLPKLGARTICCVDGRTSDDQITLFEGTGVGLQDIVVAASVVNLAEGKGIATKVDY